MIPVQLNDPRYCHLPKVFATLVVKRKSVDLYKARLCAMGDLVPLTDVAFASSPTANRTCVRIVLTLATTFRWQIKALDISQAFPQSTNINENDRLIIIPPPMITLPWKSSLPGPATDLRYIGKTQWGFLLVRPLYGAEMPPCVGSSRSRLD